ncbi:MAG: right-handed parallel beta-helix repeat-containing protein [Clostridia bacterium]|nr:right-handed parallel beta-helix repeat-containing protein [Clostridia bacterium]
MAKYYTTALGLKPSETQCCADALERIIGDLPNGSELVLGRGRWFLSRRLQISGKKNFTLSGENATLVSHFDNVDVSKSDGAIRFTDCENLTVRNLQFDYDIPINMAGRVVSIDREAGTFDIKVFDSFKCVGNERFEAFNSMDEEQTPDYKFVSYSDCPKEYLGNNTYRINAGEMKLSVDRIEDNHLMVIRHVKYGPQLLIFKGVFGCTLEDITIYASAGLTYLIAPRCSDFNFIRCSLRLPENSERLFASNADGMHVVGLTGKLYMKDCYFENMGDDALNMHSTAGTVFTDPENNTFKCVYGRINTRLDSLLDDDWAKAGDILNIYEQESFDHVASVRVVSYKGNDVVYEPIFGEFKKGNIVGNTALYAETHLDGCTVYNTRARAFLFQTENILVENCHIHGMSGCAMILSPDIRKWHEVGPCKNVVIRNNMIEKCGYAKLPSNIGAIAVKCCHDAGLTDSPAGVHENFTIEGNTFRNLGASGVFALAVKGITVKNNRFENCSSNRFSEDVESIKYDVALMNCDDAEVSGNTSDRGEANALHLNNVKLK